ncbi:MULTISPECIES: hypothetical protein [unclassified Streptomyces]|uniref:hypothetical protein n=1 Tax=unclassified Streptomyces TaxID=2593676 RepID=UPI002E80E7EC|nr:hypothetical protein [Streptomyces sp. NBC_00589]WTI37470.1 hypothetical protein OIC96_21850 [Streptomyces sp. NBC_00775]WUB28852.1 hypothetical protein OHA51_27885 [Streptomyces sp. NBC_00589]
MPRPLPDPKTPLGYRRDGRPIYPILGADPTDTSNQQLPPGPNTDPALPPAQVPDQEALNRLLAREKQQGERAAIRKLVEQLGFTKTDDLTTFVQQQREAQAAQLSEIERREQVAAEATTAAQRREAQAVVRERAAVRRSALVALGATGDDLKDAERLLAVEDDADEDTIAEAATALKARRPELFATTTLLPPAAPGGSPAGGPPPRGANMPKPGQHGADMARQRGFVTGS